jgi:hypothetical protein
MAGRCLFNSSAVVTARMTKAGDGAGDDGVGVGGRDGVLLSISHVSAGVLGFEFK